MIYWARFLLSSVSSLLRERKRKMICQLLVLENPPSEPVYFELTS